MQVIQLELTKDDDVVVLAVGLDSAPRMFGTQLTQGGSLAISDVLGKLKAIESVLAKLQTAAADTEVQVTSGLVDGEDWL